MVGRTRDYFGLIRNETLKKGHEGRERRGGRKNGENKESGDIFF